MKLHTQITFTSKNLNMLTCMHMHLHLPRQHTAFKEHKQKTRQLCRPMTTLFNSPPPRSHTHAP